MILLRLKFIYLKIFILIYFKDFFEIEGILNEFLFRVPSIDCYYFLFSGALSKRNDLLTKWERKKVFRKNQSKIVQWEQKRMDPDQ